jgi:cell division protein FtsN
MASNQYNPRRPQAVAAKKKKPSGASKAARPQVPGWAWLVAGIAVGLFVSFLVKLAGTPANNVATSALKNGEKISKSATLETKAAANKATEKSADVDKSAEKNGDKTTVTETKPATRFDFYTLLPEREVIVPNEREAIKPGDKQKTAAGQNTAADADESLFLQVGSFRSAQEADRRRAQIILLGLEAKVESVLANGDTWYRVQSGPFTSRDKLSKARNQLSAEGIESLLLKQKPQG